MKDVEQRAKGLDLAAILTMRDLAIPFLRMSLGITYIWFGALKVVGKSPIADLVAQTVFFLPRRLVVPLLGLWEMAVGLGLLFRFPLRLTLVAFYMQLVGTFMPFIVRPDETFQNGDPLLLTDKGEFIVKNLVLASAGLAVGSTVGRKTDKIQPAAPAQTENAKGLSEV